MNRPDHRDSPFEDAEVTITGFSHIATWLRSWLTPKKSVIALIVLLYGLGNIIIPVFVSSFNPRNDGVAFFFVGALTAQIGLLAAGTAFTRGSIFATLTLNSMLIVFLCASYIAGLQFAHSGMPKEAALFLFALGFGAYFLTTGCLLAIRWMWKMRFEIQAESGSESFLSLTEHNFSIRYIMLTTAAIALAICVLRWTMPDKSQGLPPKFFQLVAMCIIESIESILFLIICIQLVMNQSRRMQIGSLIIALTFLVLFPYVNALLVQFFTRALLYEYLPMAYGYIIGLAFFLILTLSLLRLVGFRLSRRLRRIKAASNAA